MIISGFRIFPAANGAQVRTSGIARALARIGYDVLIYSLAGRASDYKFRVGRRYLTDPIAPGLVEETHLGAGYGLLQTAVRRLDHPRYWQHKLMSAGYVPRRCKDALNRADVILSDMSYVPVIRGRWATKPWYLISHNLEHQLLEQDVPRRRRYADWMRGVERSAASYYSDIFAVSDEEKNFFEANDPTGRLRVPIVPCAVDSVAYQPAPGERERVRAELGLVDADRLIVFAASLYPPNIEACERIRRFAVEHARWLAEQHIYFLILGSVAPRPERSGALIVTGRVPDVVPYFAASDVGLNPITRGAGANVKLFEYIASGLPVISTSFGVRGTSLVMHQDYVHFEADDLLTPLTRFVREGDAMYWRGFADRVWERHRAQCDITEVMRDAIQCARDFPSPDSSTAKFEVVS